MYPCKFWRSAAAVALLVAGCAKPADDPTPENANGSANAGESAAHIAPRKIAEHRAGLHNLVQASERVYTGSEPHGDEAFAELKKMGVTTIVSVDGAEPNVEAAKKAGLRYIHIPFGYDGIADDAGAALARVARDVKGPIYVHCHHGKHRGPAGAAVLCQADGTTGESEALEILKIAGTDKKYAGLWRDVEKYKPPAADAQLPELVEIAKVESLAAAMAQVDRASDNLKLCAEAGWKVPPDHPDVDPPHEALMLLEGLKEAERNLEGDYDDRFKQWLGESVQLAGATEAALKSGDDKKTAAAFQAMQNACNRCHVEYRN
jgi:protein tyrosine phosphatase (PTP) superfamily phosphohydrolase (DUF442 family)